MEFTNVPLANAEELERPVPWRLSLGESLEFCRDDECGKVTPDAIRLSSVVPSDRARARARSKLGQM